MYGPLPGLPALSADARAREAKSSGGNTRSWDIQNHVLEHLSNNRFILGALHSYFECYKYDLESETDISAIHVHAVEFINSES